MGDLRWRRHHLVVDREDGGEFAGCATRAARVFLIVYAAVAHIPKEIRIGQQLDNERCVAVLKATQTQARRVDDTHVRPGDAPALLRLYSGTSRAEVCVTTGTTM